MKPFGTLSIVVGTGNSFLMLLVHTGLTQQHKEINKGTA